MNYTRTFIGEGSRINKEQSDSSKPLKYYLQNFHDLKDIANRGINFNDGFGVHSNNIVQSNNLRYSQITNPKCVQELPTLPLATTANLSKGQGPTDVEDSIRPVSTTLKKSCQPQGTEYYNRSFYFWDHLPVRPNGCVNNIVPISNGYYMGEPTRKLSNYNKK